MAGNPVLMRTNRARRGPSVRIIAPIVVGVLAAAGITAAVLHHRANPPAAQIASAAPPAMPAQPAPGPLPTVAPGPAPAASPQTLAVNPPAPSLHRRASRTGERAASAEDNAANSSAVAPSGNPASFSLSPGASAGAAPATPTVIQPTPAIPAPVAPYAATPAAPNPSFQNPATVTPPAAVAPAPAIAAPAPQ